MEAIVITQETRDEFEGKKKPSESGCTLKAIKIIFCNIKCLVDVSKEKLQFNTTFSDVMVDIQ